MLLLLWQAFESPALSDTRAAQAIRFYLPLQFLRICHHHPDESGPPGADAPPPTNQGLRVKQRPIFEERSRYEPYLADNAFLKFTAGKTVPKV